MLTGYLVISSSCKIQSRPQFLNTCQLFIESGYYVIVQFPVQSHPQHTIVQWEVHCGEERILGSFHKRNERTVSNLSRETQTHKLVRGLVQAVWSSCLRADRDTPSLFCNVNNNMWMIYSIFRCWCHGDRITRLTLGVITRFRRSLWNDRKSVTSLEMNRLYRRSTSIYATINSAAAQIRDVPQLVENILAWLPQPLLPVPVGGGLGAKEKKKKKTGCGYTVVMATEARWFEPPHPATVRGERTASAYRNISNMHAGTRIRACAIVTAVHIIPEQQLSVC